MSRGGILHHMGPLCVWCGVVEAGVQPPPICVTRRIRIVSKVSNKPHSKPSPTITSKPSPNKHNRFLEPAPPSKSDLSTIRPTRVGSPEPPHLLEPSTFEIGVMDPKRLFTWQDSSSPHRPCKLKSMHSSTSSVGPADGHQTSGVMAHVQVMQAQGILHQALRWWGPAGGHQTLGVMARVCKITKF